MASASNMPCAEVGCNNPTKSGQAKFCLACFKKRAAAAGARSGGNTVRGDAKVDAGFAGGRVVSGQVKKNAGSAGGKAVSGRVKKNAGSTAVALP